MTFSDTNILLIGAGNMGSALLFAWLHAGIPSANVTIVEADAQRAKRAGKDGVQVLQSIAAVQSMPQCVVLAVKPQSMDALLPLLAGKFGKGPLYLSIAAGKTLEVLAKELGDVAIVRAMPNTPALIRKGISALCASRQVNARQKELATQLLGAAGETVWLDDESLMDAVTAVSGSGPAYVFLFLEVLIEAGRAQGLPEDIATKLALHTLRGSVKLAMKSGESLEQLRKNVTSPGGTTEAALSVLMKSDTLKRLMDEAVAAAVKRGKELA